MPLNLEGRIRQHLARVVAGRESLRSFNRWFVPATWNIKAHPRHVRELVYSVKARLDEHDKQYLTRSGLFEKLRLILSSYQIGNLVADFMETNARNFIADASRMPANLPTASVTLMGFPPTQSLVAS
jgi:hypothetical protein